MLYYSLPSAVAFTTTRDTLTPEAPYAGFNITHYCGDAPQHVQECRAALCERLHISDDHLILPHQMHGTESLLIDKEFLTLEKSQQFAALEGVDAVLTQESGVCIGVSTADCVPILLFDPVHHASAAIHAGWRGLSAHIIRRVAEEMCRCLGSVPAQMLAVIGPHIRVEDFEVGEEVCTEFLRQGFEESLIDRTFPKPHIDLTRAACSELLAQGLRAEHLHDAKISTYAALAQFPSARRLGIRSVRAFTGILMPE